MADNANPNMAADAKLDASNDGAPSLDGASLKTTENSSNVVQLTQPDRGQETGQDVAVEEEFDLKSLDFTHSDNIRTEQNASRQELAGFISGTNVGINSDRDDIVHEVILPQITADTKEFIEARLQESGLLEARNTILALDTVKDSAKEYMAREFNQLGLRSDEYPGISKVGAQAAKLLVA